MQVVAEEVLRDSIVTESYRVVSVQSGQFVRELLSKAGEDLHSLNKCKMDSMKLKNLLEAYYYLKGTRIQSNPFFGWVSFGRYPIEDEDLFSEMFFSNTLTDINFLTTPSAGQEICVLDLEVSMNDALIIDVSNFGLRNSFLVENPDPTLLKNSVLDTMYCMFPKVNINMINRIGVLSFVGEESTFVNSGKKYVCRSFVPDNNLPVTPEMYRDESFYKKTKMSIWSLRFKSLKTGESYDLTWPAGCTFSGLSVVPAE
jgi:hypothetical protein